MKSTLTKIGLTTLATLLLLFLSPPSHTFAGSTLILIKGLREAAAIVRDSKGIPHIFAANDHDIFFLQGWVHARDRFFQMDVKRREASGTLAELLGPAALPSDVELRTIGLRRAADRSLPLLSSQVRKALEAYSAGVNAFITSHPLPPEYNLLELTLTQVEPWSPIDSLVIGKKFAFDLSFDLDDIDRTIALTAYQQAGVAVGFDGTALFFEDLFRSAPFDPASTVPDASQPLPLAALPSEMVERARIAGRQISPETLSLCRRYLERIRHIPFFRRILRRINRSNGSNEWVVSGRHTASGFPLLANDPHLSLDMPATFYQVHLRTPDLNVIGSGFAGLPFVVVGHNRLISWGATTNPMDVTDTFQEKVEPDPSSPSGLSIKHQEQLEPIIPLPQVFSVNVRGDGVFDNVVVAPPDDTIPAAVLIVPRRNQGPIVEIDPPAGTAEGTALSVQYTGFSGTRELDAFFIWNRARNLDDFKRGLQFFDFGSQNWAYADVQGNIAYFTSGELPLREDLQAGFVNGLPPFFIREGTGGNEWLPVSSPQPGQAVPFEILPFEEMPQTINPLAGFFVNANNDPAGITLDNDPLNQLRPDGGFFYLSPGYDFGTRAGRITQAITERLTTGRREISRKDMKMIQADTVMLDAQVLVPFILQAFENGQSDGAHLALAALAADPRVDEAVGRLEEWDFSTPTGIPEGFDASDKNGQRFPPSEEEIASSIAATIYSVWRGQIIRNTIEAVLGQFALPRPSSQRAMIALRHLLDNFDQNEGIGASGLNFFNVPDVDDLDDPATRRDILLLQSLVDALNLLAGPKFDKAFGGSTNQDDYRWGRLHRIVFDHPLNGPFDVPPAGSAFPPPLENLAGIPTDGGFGVVDASSHSARADDDDGFMFGSGPVNRFVSEMGPWRVRAESSLPGGESGILESPFYVNLLGRWLTNDTFRLLVSPLKILANASSVQVFVPRR